MPTELDFFQFIYKRQLIWYKRFVLKQDYPWTDDPVLKTYKIINMYRELDKCTVYIIDKLKNIKDRKTILLNVIFYRFFNLMSLYEDLGISPFSQLDSNLKDKLLITFNELRKTRPIFNNAYLISSGGKGIKHEHILNNLSQIDLDLLIKNIDNSRTTEESFSHLVALPMVGPFLACEMWTDLTYFNWFKQKWTDNDFVNIGPGAKWGLEILHGKLSKRELNEKLYHLYNIQKKILPTVHQELGQELSWQEIAYKQAYSNYPFLSITNIEGALCEFRKYWRLGDGKGKKRYFRFLID
ncbi:hypothetical protein HYT55_04710 [Candidatus Woesearchaeota archaeon]|nr:hypothetical protein [Candidatus Woesearchaeota archaeon]